MNVSEALQQIEDNNDYIKKLCQRLKDESMGRDRAIEELICVVENNQECLEIVSQELGVVSDS